MTKIKELLARLKKALGSAPKSGQGKAFVRVIQFFAVMLVLTIFARGASGATMPRVTSAGTHGAEVINSIDTTGTVSAQGSVDIELPAGLTIKRIVTQSGSTVKEGTTLLEFDIDALEDKINDEQIALRNLELELREMQLPGEPDKSVETAQKQVDKAQADYDDASKAVNRANDAVSAAYSYHDEAVKVREDAQAAYENERDKPDEERNDEEAQRLLDEYLAADLAQASAWEAIGNVEMELNTAKQTKDMAGDTLSAAQESLNDAREAAARAAQQQAITDEKNSIAMEQKQTEIEKQKELIKTLETAKSAEGTVVAPSAGVVTQMPGEEGEETGEKSIVRITTSDEGYIVECQVEQKEAGEIKIGDNLSVKKSGYGYYGDAPVISKTVPDASGMVTIRASLAGTDWETGDSLEVQVVTKRQYYNTCVPLSAVHSDANGYYVYVLREENTILGEQTVARRVDVTIQAQDRTNIAIDGSIWGEQILITSTKPVNEGDRVRIEGSAS